MKIWCMTSYCYGAWRHTAMVHDVILLWWWRHTAMVQDVILLWCMTSYCYGAWRHTAMVHDVILLWCMTSYWYGGAYLCIAPLLAYTAMVHDFILLPYIAYCYGAWPHTAMVVHGFVSLLCKPMLLWCMSSYYYHTWHTAMVHDLILLWCMTSYCYGGAYLCIAPLLAHAAMVHEFILLPITIHGILLWCITSYCYGAWHHTTMVHDVILLWWCMSLYRYFVSLCCYGAWVHTTTIHGILLWCMTSYCYGAWPHTAMVHDIILLWCMMSYYYGGACLCIATL